MHKGKVIVTGGLGYIGSHTVVALISAGYEAVVIDNLSNSSLFILDQIELITGVKPVFYQSDVCEITEIRKILTEQGAISGIVHFAAYKSVPESLLHPVKYYNNNVGSLLTLLGLIKESDINFVFSSSCTIYGQPETLPVSEDAPINRSLTPYGKSKQYAEEILMDVAAAEGNRLNICSLRYFNPVGAHPSGLIGELPNGVPQNLVPFITQSAIGIRDRLMVYGNDYDTPDGTCMRDFIHVVDLAKAHVQALEWMDIQKHPKYNSFNIGTGKGISVLELIAAFNEVSGLELAYEMGKRRPGDIAQIWANVSRANTEMGWKAQSDAKEMMLSAWKWQQYLETINLS